MVMKLIPTSNFQAPRSEVLNLRVETQKWVAKPFRGKVEEGSRKEYRYYYYYLE